MYSKCQSRPTPAPFPYTQPVVPPQPFTTTRVSQPDVALLRISLRPSTQFPWEHAGTFPTTDKDGSPLFLGIAAFKNGMHPCKIRPTMDPMLWVSYGDKEHPHRGSGYLLPFDPNTMEWVRASEGRIPNGRRPVDGGYETSIGGPKLYHALAVVGGIRTPGKTGAHLVNSLSPVPVKIGTNC